MLITILLYNRNIIKRSLYEKALYQRRKETNKARQTCKRKQKEFLINSIIHTNYNFYYTNESNTKYRYYIQGNILVGYIPNYCKQTEDKDIKCKDENLVKTTILTKEEKEILKNINIEIKNNNNIYLESETCKALAYVLKKDQIISENGNVDWDLYYLYDTNKDNKTTYLEYGDEYLRSIYNGI